MDTSAIRAIVNRHKKWRLEQRGGRRADLRNAELREAELGWVDLSGADLRNADLTAADLVPCAMPT
ncbi:MAG: pentapeptide repeat-containing protein [Halobacteriota archaeon]|jgi:uncharacterized protein YjbI with pentapeptide repeats